MQLIACHVPRILRRRGMIKMFMIMKLTTILTLAICINVSANGFSQNVNLREVNSPLDKVFKEIKKQTGYTFVYTKALLKKANKVTVSVSNVPLEQALDACFSDQPLTYTIFNKMIVIKEKEIVVVVKPDTPVESVLPAITISGKIVNDRG